MNFIELQEERAAGGGSVFVNMDRVTSAHLSADSKTLTISYGPGDLHPFQGEENIRTLLLILRTPRGLPQVPHQPR